MGRDNGGPSSHKRNGSNSSMSRKGKDEKAGPSRRSKEKKAVKIVHTVNIADKNKNNKTSIPSSKCDVKVTPVKLVVARAKRLRARPEHQAGSPSEIDKSEKKELEAWGYILSNIIGRDVGCLKYKTHYIEASKTSSLRRKYHLWCKIVDTSNGELLDDFKGRELGILAKLKHPNVVQLHSVLQKGRKSFYFTTGSMYGNVLDFLANYGPLIENHGRVWFRQVLNGLEYLFCKSISHGDLNCESLLLGDHYNILIGDFGYATCASSKLSTQLNKSLYTAPEVLLGDSYNPRLADMWSLGVVLYAFYMGHPPFQYYGDEDEQIAKLVVDQLQMVWLYRVDSNALSPHSWETICSLLQPDVLKRANLQFLKESPFYSMKECVCGHGSFKALSLEILSSLPDIYTIVKPPKKSKSDPKNESKSTKVVCPMFKEFFSPRKELSLKIEDVEHQAPTLITISDDGSPY